MRLEIGPSPSILDGGRVYACGAMPPLPPAAQIVLVRIKGVFGTQPWNVIQHLQYTGPAPTVADLQTVATSVNSAFNTNYASLMPVGVSVTGIDLADLTNPAAAAASVSTTVTGTRAGTIMPASTCIVVSWIINVRYRGGHPRSYYPFGVAADTQSVRAWTTAFVTSVNNASTAYRTALNAISVSGTTYKMAVVSYVHNNAPRPTPVPFTVQSNVTHARIDTQRRRLGKEIP